jgi:hypothetical protein
MESDCELHGETELSQQLWRIYSRGFMNATSIGFIPLSFKDLEGVTPPYPFCDTVRQYTTWEMYEYSLVNVPMNPGAVMTGDDEESAKSYLKSLKAAQECGVIKSDDQLWTMSIAEYITNAASTLGAMRREFEAALSSRINVLSNTNTEQPMNKDNAAANAKRRASRVLVDKSLAKAIDQATAEQLSQDVATAVKNTLQQILTKADVDFSTTDLATIAADCAEDVIEMLMGTSDEPQETPTAGDPASQPQQQTADPNAPPADPNATPAQKDAPTFATALDAVNAFLPIHQQELDIATAAVAIADVPADVKDFFQTILDDTPDELAELQDLQTELQAESDQAAADAQGADAGKSFRAAREKKGAKLGKELRTHASNVQTALKTAQKSMKQLMKAAEGAPAPTPPPQEQPTQKNGKQSDASSQTNKRVRLSDAELTALYN